ncbi:MAG: MFS transporter [Brevinema sp.]
MIEKPKFGFRDQLGYFFGDFANGMFFMLTASYLTLFYVDVLGLTAASVGILLLVARIWDAINDPIIGGWIDRQPADLVKGKFRPWIIYMAIPVVIFGILTFFAVPALISAPIHVRLIYAYLTYIGFGMSYTAVNIPYGSLASTMTDVEAERATLSMFRSYGAIAAAFSLNTLLPFVVFDSNRRPTATGFIKLTVILGTIAIISYALCNKLTTERIIVPQKPGQQRKMSDTLKGISKNRPLIIQMLVGLIVIVLMLLQGSLAPYLFKDYFQNTGAIAINGLLMLVGTIVVSPFMKPAVAKFGKKMVSVVGLLVYIAAWIVYLVFPIKDVVTFFIIAGVGQIGLSCLSLITWAFIPDCIDYQEYVTGIREEGTIYAIYSFARKLGQAGTGFLGAYTLIWVGYVAGQEAQSPETLTNIRLYYGLIPVIIGSVLTAVLYFGYNLDKATLDKVTQILREKREQNT